MDRFTDILFVVLGWLLGTLTPGVTEAIRRPKRRDEIFAALRSEFVEIRYKLALVAHNMRARTGTMSHGSLALVRPIIMGYEGNSTDGALRESVTKLLSQGEGAYIALHNTRKGQGSPYPVRYESPFLEAHLHDLGLLSPKVQETILRLRAEFHLFNEQVDQVRQAHDRSFTIADKTNHALNNQNYEAGLEKLAYRAETVIREIDDLVGPATT